MSNIVQYTENMVKEKNTMNFELLPNEIFFNLFDYMNSIDLLLTFYNLNSRFNILLHKQYRFYCFKFQFVSKRKFDIICQQHLPFVSDRVISLRLVNGWDTPEQINLFFSYTPSFKQFTHLRSLKIFFLNSYQILSKLLDELHYLNNLTHLTFYFCYIQDEQINLQSIVNYIWSLPKLTSCCYQIELNEQSFYLPTVVSSSLECIRLINDKFTLNQLKQLIEYTPRLKRLEGCRLSPINDNYILSPLPTLIQLKLDFSSSNISNLIILLKNIPNLRHLDIKISKIIDGHQWKQIILNYLPKLETLQFKMQAMFIFETNLEKRIDDLIKTFQSSFWINEHQWFVRCFTKNFFIYVYTISQPLDYFECIEKSWKMTCPYKNYQKIFNNMTTLDDRKFFNQPILYDIHLSNIKYLSISFPIKDQFWSVITNLNRLYSLDVSSYADIYQSQLQTLLNKTTHLNSLTISQDPSLPLQTSIGKCTNASVRVLYLSNYNHCFNTEECIKLIHMPIVIQCEALSIEVNNPESIIIIIKNMINLRSLTVNWNNKKNPKQLSLITNNDKSYNENSLCQDELIQWLRDHLPTTYVITKYPKLDNHIQIWI